MSHANILDPERALLLVVDVQEAFRGAIGDFALVASNIARAVSAFSVLGVDVAVTEQYPKGLGPTAEEVALMLPETARKFEKTAFSAARAAGLAALLSEKSITQVVLCGFEAHVCVSQTAHDLIQHGVQVHLLTDCVASRFAVDRSAGLDKMRAAGAIPSSIETSLFELMRDSRHEKFKSVQALIK